MSHHTINRAGSLASQDLRDSRPPGDNLTRMGDNTAETASLPSMKQRAQRKYFWLADDEPLVRNTTARPEPNLSRWTA